LTGSLLASYLTLALVFLQGVFWFFFTPLKKNKILVVEPFSVSSSQLQHAVHPALTHPFNPLPGGDLFDSYFMLDLCHAERKWNIEPDLASCVPAEALRPS
jgi:hypothetical protein